MGSIDLFRLNDRVAIVTGASRGLGRAIALGFAEAGAHVVLCARDRVRLESVAEEIRGKGGSASIISFDLADHQAVENAIPAIVAAHGRVDILVNNGGISEWSAFTESTTERWQTVFDTNVTAMYVLSREAAKPMIAQGKGRIINFGSYVSTIGRERLAAYTASKHAVAGLTKSIAGELGRHNVTCNAIAPGFLIPIWPLPPLPIRSARVYSGRLSRWEGSAILARLSERRSSSPPTRRPMSRVRSFMSMAALPMPCRCPSR